MRPPAAFWPCRAATARTGLTRYIYGLEPARSRPAAAFKAAFADALQHAISGPMAVASPQPGER